MKCRDVEIYPIKESPWGHVDDYKEIAKGIAKVGTPSHGGFFVEESLNQKIPNYMRIDSGWYEEDCDWAIVAAWFKEFFSPEDIESAMRTLKHWHPDSFEKLTGKAINPGESIKRDEKEFYTANKDNWVCTAAWGSWHEHVPKGMVGVVAQKGGRKGMFKGDVEERFALVAEDKYKGRTTNGYVLTGEEQDWCGPY